jgi:hypothetical protein
MANDPFPPIAIFIRFGDFQAGAFGQLAIIALLVLAAGFFFGRYRKLW